jgi:hypothetical protein
MNHLPPLRHFLYVLGTVNVIMAVVLLIAAFVFNEGVNLVAVLFVAVVVNLISALTVARQP